MKTFLEILATLLFLVFALMVVVGLAGCTAFEAIRQVHHIGQ